MAYGVGLVSGNYERPLEPIGSPPPGASKKSAPSSIKTRIWILPTICVNLEVDSSLVKPPDENATNTLITDC